MAGTSYKGSEIESVDQFLKGDGLDSARERRSASTSATATMSTWCPITPG